MFANLRNLTAKTGAVARKPGNFAAGGYSGFTSRGRLCYTIFYKGKDR